MALRSRTRNAFETQNINKNNDKTMELLGSFSFIFLKIGSSFNFMVRYDSRKLWFYLV